MQPRFKMKAAQIESGVSSLLFPQEFSTSIGNRTRAPAQMDVGEPLAIDSESSDCCLNFARAQPTAVAPTVFSESEFFLRA